MLINICTLRKSQMSTRQNKHHNNSVHYSDTEAMTPGLCFNFLIHIDTINSAAEPSSLTERSWGFSFELYSAHLEWTRARRIMWLIAIVQDSFATQAPSPWYQTLVVKKDLNHKSSHDHHLHKHLKREALQKELDTAWVTEWGICNFRGPWHPASVAPHWHNPPEVVWAPNKNASQLNGTMGQTQSSCGDKVFQDYVQNDDSCPHFTLDLTWING